MGLGVLETKTAVVQGSVQLYEGESQSGTYTGTSHLKHSSDRKIVLSPQPSDDPDDPLNWPKWRRNMSYILILTTAILSLLHGPILSPVTVDLAIQFNRSINDIAQLSSYMLLVIAGFAYIFSILARLYGKRGLFLLAAATLVAADSWAACATSYNSLLGARILSGVGQAMYEAMGLAIVPDLFFVHERGKRVALFLFFSQTGTTLGVPIATQIATKLGGFQSCFKGLAISESIMLVLLFFFFPECAYPREHVDALAHQDQDAIIADVLEHTKTREELKPAVEMSETVPDNGNALFVERAAGDKFGTRYLGIFSGKMTKRTASSIAWRTVALTFHPTILWCAIAGLPLSWPVGVSFTLALTLQAPPYNFTADDVGNMYIAAWVGTIVGLALGSTLDKFVKILAQRNRYVYEPEFRLWYLVPGMLLFLLGYAGWGWGVEALTPWIGLAFFFCFMFGGACLANVSIISYLLDAHRLYAVESQVILFSFKNLFGFSMGYFFVEWYTAAGPKTVFGIICGINVAIALFGVPLYLFGKHLRAYWMTHPFLNITEMLD